MTQPMTAAYEASSACAQNAAQYLTFVCGGEEYGVEILRVQEIKGVPSIAEASALVAAGSNARLLGARVAANRITCAIAIGEGS